MTIMQQLFQRRWAAVPNATAWLLILLLPAVASAAVSVKDANKSVVKLRPGGPSATVLIEGRELDTLQSAFVQGQPGVSISLGSKIGGDMRVLKIRVADGVPEGRYAIQLKSSAGAVASVPSSIVELQVGQLRTVDKTPKSLRSLPSLAPPPRVRPRAAAAGSAVSGLQNTVSVLAVESTPVAQIPPQPVRIEPESPTLAKTAVQPRGLVVTEVLRVPAAGKGVASSDDALKVNRPVVVDRDFTTYTPANRPALTVVPKRDLVADQKLSIPPAPPVTEVGANAASSFGGTAPEPLPPAYRQPSQPVVLPAEAVNLGEGDVLSVTAGNYGLASEQLDYQNASSALEPKSGALLVLEGVVRDADTGRPIGNAKVQLGDLRTVSRSDGTYRIEVDPSKTGINAGAKGYRVRELEPWQRPQTMVLKQDIRLASVDSAIVEDQSPQLRQKSNAPTSARGPDLVFPTQPSLPACKGAEVSVRLPIENIGRETAQDYQITLSTQHAGAGRFDRRIDSVVVGGPTLAPGASAVVDVELRLDGTEELIELSAIADSGQRLREQDESNNLLLSGHIDMRYVPSCAGVRSRQPDLAVVQRLGFGQRDSGAGCEIAIEAMIQNLNNRNAPPSTLELQIADARVSKSWRKTISVPAISAGDEQAVLLRAPMDAVLSAIGKSGKAGVGSRDALTVSVVADAGQQVAEAFETNNTVLVERTLAELMGENNLRYRRVGEPCWE